VEVENQRKQEAADSSGECRGRLVGISAPRPVAVLLALVAGIVDSTTFMALFGLFVAQVTGSFVTLGVHIVTLDKTSLVSLVAIPFFFMGAVVAAMIATAQAPAPRAFATALAIEAALLGAFAAVGLTTAQPASADALPPALMGILGLAAMGVQSATARLMLDGVASTNVMTTNTTQLAIDVTQWLIASWHAARLPHETTARAMRTAAGAGIVRVAPTMAGFFAGTLAGAVGFVYLGFWFLLAAIAVLIGLIDWALRQHAIGHNKGEARPVEPEKYLAA
jgi:uncharacterized membrane protein YoaK (UPF0700 family)